MEDWTHTGIFSIDECAQGCSATPECTAFSLYHETGLCYYYKPKEVQWTDGFLPKVGICFTKEEIAKEIRDGREELWNILTREEVGSLVIDEEDGFPKLHDY